MLHIKDLFVNYKIDLNQLYPFLIKGIYCLWSIQLESRSKLICAHAFSWYSKVKSSHVGLS
ncbi:MAG: hypothetical protein UX46_C0006G0061 [Candidatus Amesbacteria bacterium GW2011_GWC1_46_24]|nr:MAG: hypothetical protein UX46_C0006G0061 [Candidatus Amesbacteria bacterium GW2011_GWC1_46_24]